MSAELANRVLSRFKNGEGRVKTAAFPPPPPPSGGGGSSTRDIPKDHPFDPRALKPMSQALWATSVALGHALTAYRQLNRLKSAAVSPDGLLGGRGYVMGIKDARQKLYSACESLSTIADTLYDEIQAPHWKPKLAMLDENEAEDVSRYVEESQEILDDPEADADKEMKEIEEENDGKATAHPPKDDSLGSALPGAGPQEESEAQPPKLTPQQKEASKGRPFFAASFEGSSVWPEAFAEVVPEASVKASTEPPKRVSLSERIVARLKAANSSLPVDTLPGPRVDHLDRGDAQGPWGSYNEDEPAPADDSWQQDEGVGNDYAYPSEWENNLSDTSAADHEAGWPHGKAPSYDDLDRFPGKGPQPSMNDYRTIADLLEKGWTPDRILSSYMAKKLKLTEKDIADEKKKKKRHLLAESMVPSDPDTATEGWDFGLGYGARGQGAGDYANPSDEGRGVWGPHSDLPGSPAGPSGDNTPYIDVSLNERQALIESLLPGDTAPPVARSDYYDGPKDNLVQGQDPIAESELPGEASPWNEEEFSMVDTLTLNEDLETPYVRYDHTTPSYRDDPLHTWPQEG